MTERSSLEDVAEHLRSVYSNQVVLVKDNYINLHIEGLDLSNAEMSVPEDGGPFKTLDSPADEIPAEIRNVVQESGYSCTVLGHGPDRLHVHVK
jgi:hypothetical protein